MKIEIDTKHDSPNEIRKVIKMLQHLVGEHAYSNQPNIFEDTSSFGASSSPQGGSQEAGNAFVNMFGSAIEPKEEPMDKKEKPSEGEKKAEDIPEVIFY